jgi:putative cell wall-binding protein
MLRVAVATLLFGCLFFGLGTNAYAASSEPTISYHIGENRYQTASLLAQQSHPSGSDGAIIAYGFNFPDALAAGVLAGTFDFPILLTETNSPPATTLEALQRLRGQKAPEDFRIVIIGGPGVVSESCAQALAAYGSVERINGDDRYATNRAIIAEAATDVDTCIIAYGRNFPDALAVSPLSVKAGYPIILVGETLDAAQLEVIQHYEKAILVGGEAAISKDTENTVVTAGLSVSRWQGADRYDTALAIAKNLIRDHGFSLNGFVYTTGIKFPDALAGSVTAAKNGAPVLLLDSHVTWIDVPSDAPLYNPNNVPSSQFNSATSYAAMEWLLENAGPVTVAHQAGGYPSDKSNGSWGWPLALEGKGTGILRYVGPVSFRVAGALTATGARVTFDGMGGRIFVVGTPDDPRGEIRWEMEFPDWEPLVIEDVWIDALDIPAPPLTLRLGQLIEGWYTAPYGGGTKVSFPLVVTGNMTLYPNWKPTSTNGIAADIAAKSSRFSSDYDRLEVAARFVGFYSRLSWYAYDYTWSNPRWPNHWTADAVLSTGYWTCAGTTRALGLVLDKMGYSWKFVNRNLNVHQWNLVYTGSGTYWADGQLGDVGTGDRGLPVYRLD